MKLNKGLNLDVLPSNSETGDYRYAKNISLDNTLQYPINEKGLKTLGISNIEFSDIAGIIPYDKGMVVFANSNYIYVINTNLENEVVEKTIYVYNIWFTKDRPVRGTYTYNQNKDLIIIFSSGVDGNFEDKILNLTTCSTFVAGAERYLMDINPNVIFPKISTEETTGSLLSGCYQFSITYKHEKEYTNHSLLSLPIYIFNNSESNKISTSGINEITNKGILINFEDLDTNYNTFRIAIIYNDGTSFKVYYSQDLLTTTNEYTLNTLTDYKIGSLDETLINSIFYSNSESLSVMNNRLYRANMKNDTLLLKYTNDIFDEVAQEVANNLSLELKSTPITDFNNIQNKQLIKFQNDEVYALYLTLGDKKGNIIGSYPIKSKYTNYPKLHNVKGFTDKPISFRVITIPNPYTIHESVINNAVSITKTIIPITYTHEVSDPLLGEEENIGFSFIYNPYDTEQSVQVNLVNSLSYNLTIQFIIEYLDTNNDTQYYNDSITVPAFNSTAIKLIYIPNFQSGSLYHMYPNKINQRFLTITLNSPVPEGNYHFNFNFVKNGIDVISHVVTLSEGQIANTISVNDLTFDTYNITTNNSESHKYSVNVQYAVLKDTDIRINFYDIYSNLLFYKDLKILQGNLSDYVEIQPNSNIHSYNIQKLQGIDFLSLHLTVHTPLITSTSIKLNVSDNFEVINNSITNFTILVETSISNLIQIQIDDATKNITEHSKTYGTDINFIRYTSEFPLYFNTTIIAHIRNMSTVVQTLYTIFLNNTLSKDSDSFQYPMSSPNINHPEPLVYDYPSEYANYYFVAKEKDIYDLSENNSYIYSTNLIEVTLPNLNLYPSEFVNKIGFWCIHRALRTNTNSRIYTQGITRANPAIGYNENLGLIRYTKPDTIHNVNDRLSWKFEADSYFPIRNNHLITNRFYSFEDLFNKSIYFPTNKIDFIGKYNDINWSNNQIIYSSNNEKVINRQNDIQSHILKSGDNLSISNTLIEVCRELKYNYDYENIHFAADDALGGEPFKNRLRFFRANILTDTEEYYKNLYNEVLVLCSKTARFSNYNNNNKLNCIGDTFYSNFKLILTTINPDIITISNNPLVTTFGVTVNNYNNPTWLTQKLKVLEYDIFIESKYNIHARFWRGLFPDWEQPINTSEQIGYNKTYNLQNTLNIPTIVDINNNSERESNKGLYPSRIIMSQTKSKESNTLNFRKYLALDYYDMPYNRNAIISILSTSKNLYIQQELALFVASIKDVISYEEGTTYVGSGQLFDRLPIEILPTEYGFIGCNSHFNIGICDLGVWIIDTTKSLIFLISDTDVKIISNGKNQNWFNGKLKGDNPFTNNGCFITYDNSDNILKRLILTIHQSNTTISYIPSIENWFCFHDYVPKFGTFNRNNTFYLFDRIVNSNTVSRLFKYSNNIKSKFSDSNTIYRSIISLYFNEEKGANKLFQSLYWQTKFIIDNIDIYDKTFTQMFIHNDSQCTKIINIGDSAEWFNSENSVYKQEVWIFNNLLDYVKDNRKPFLANFIDFVNSNFNYHKEWFDISKFISTFACVTFIFDNYYYSIDGKRKSAMSITGIDKQPLLLLQNNTFSYKK